MKHHILYYRKNFTYTVSSSVSSIYAKLWFYVTTDPQSSVPSRLTHHIPTTEVPQSESVELPCAAQGDPNPQYM